MLDHNVDYSMPTVTPPSPLRRPVRFIPRHLFSTAIGGTDLNESHGITLRIYPQDLSVPGATQCSVTPTVGLEVVDSDPSHIQRSPQGQCVSMQWPLDGWREGKNLIIGPMDPCVSGRPVLLSGWYV